MPGPDGLRVLDGILQACPDTQVIVITGHATVESAVTAMTSGAFDYLPKPFRLDQVRLVVSRAAESKRLRDENRRLQREVAGYRQRPMVGDSVAMRAVQDAIARVAPAASTVLVVGETGTGKELVARAVHDTSPRAEGPFVALSCGAVAEPLRARRDDVLLLARHFLARLANEMGRPAPELMPAAAAALTGHDGPGSAVAPGPLFGGCFAGR